MNAKVRARILRNLPREKAFYFFTSIGNYTGESAASLKEFTEKISEVNMKSIVFHFCRGDFEKWISEVLEDGELAQQIGVFRKSSPVEEELKSELHRILSRRYSSLASNF